MSKLQGKAAIVTGATSGMGRATALLFAREGASVLASGRDPERGASSSMRFAPAAAGPSSWPVTSACRRPTSAWWTRACAHSAAWTRSSPAPGRSASAP